MQIKSYIVQPGDNLGAIAAANGKTVDELVAANGIVDPNMIAVGQQLVIPETVDLTAGGAPIADATPDLNTLVTPEIVDPGVAGTEILDVYAPQDDAAAQALAQAQADALKREQEAMALQQQQLEAAQLQAAQQAAEAAQQAAMAGVSADSATAAAMLGITPAQLDVVKAVIRQEAGNNPAEIANVASCIKNRMNSGAWGGTNPFQVVTAKSQFSAYAGGGGPFKKYTNGNYFQGDPATLANVDNTINGILTGQIPPTHSFQSFRSAESVGYSNNQLTPGGNRYA